MDYKLVYSTKDNIMGSESGFPDIATDDTIAVRADLKQYKLIYRNAEKKICGSVTGIPAEGDTVIYPIETDVENPEEEEPGSDDTGSEEPLQEETETEAE